MSGKRLTKEQKECILKDIRARHKSFQQIGKQHSVAISTVSRIAAEHGLSSPRKKSTAVGVPEHSYDRARRVSALDRMLYSIEKLVEGGGLSTRQIKDLASAAQSVYATRRAEDQLGPRDAEAEEEEKLKRVFYYSEGLGELSVDLNTPVGREFFEMDRRMGHPGYVEIEGSAEEYGSGGASEASAEASSRDGGGEGA